MNIFLKTFRVFTLLLLLGSPLGSVQTFQAAKPDWTIRVDPALLNRSASEPQEALVFLQDQADLSGAARLPTKAEKGAYVYQRLTQTAQRTQKKLLADLERQGIASQSFWVANMVWVKGDTATFKAIAQREEVRYLYANTPIGLDETGNEPALASQAGIPWNIEKVGAPLVWAAGYTGQGVVIAGQDTGYDWTHPALQASYRGWDGVQADHNYNWHDSIHSGGSFGCPADSEVPCDDGDHGTHTLGTMVGSEGNQEQVGMAPGARWIGCRNMDRGIGSPQTYSECYQWFLAPTDLEGKNPRPDLAPDIINNSWSCPPDEGCTDAEVLRTIVENVRAAGILSVQSAGNSGPACSTVNDPAAIYDASFTVGNTDFSDNINSSSGRGPVLADGSGRIKPDISAPGTSIRSTVPGGGYASKTGTSMAGPHVAGLAALILSARPDLRGQPEAIEMVMKESALHLKAGQTCGDLSGESIPNNVYGWGRIDAGAAVLNSLLTVQKAASSTWVTPSGLLTYTLTIRNQSSLTLTQMVLTDTVPPGTQYQSASLEPTITGDELRWEFAQLASGQKIEIQWTVKVGQEGTIVSQGYGVTSNEIKPVLTPEAVWAYVLKSRIYLPMAVR